MFQLCRLSTFLCLQLFTWTTFMAGVQMKAVCVCVPMFGGAILPATCGVSVEFLPQHSCGLLLMSFLFPE
jgi:hypothetical protein